MKKTILILMVLIMVLSFYACEANSSVAQTPANPSKPNQSMNNPNQSSSKPTQEVQPVKKTIALTQENINDYLILNLSVKDVTVEDWAGLNKGDGTATITIYPKRAGTFENVMLTLSLIPSSTNKEQGWSKQVEEVQLPFDGKYELATSIAGRGSGEDYMSDTPVYNITVTNVHGNFVEG